MHLNKSKSQIVTDIMWRVQSKMTEQLAYLHFSDNTNLSTFKNSVAQAVSMAVADGFRELLHNIYTNEEFEQDLGLRKGV